MRFCRAAAGALTMLFVGAGCGDDSLDTVRVCGDLAVPDDLVAVRVVVLDDTLAEVASGVAELGRPAAQPDDVRQLPIDVVVTRVGGRRVVRVQAIGEGGAEIGRAEVLVAANDELDRIVVNVSHSCLGQTCPLGQTCIDASCVIIPDAAAVQARCDPPATPATTLSPDADASGGNEETTP